jgi:translation initiation factor 1
VPDDPKRPFHNPFGALSHLRGATPQAATSATPPAEQVSPPDAATILRAVVRLERAGRGGKAVTVVEQLNLPPVERERWLTAFKSALGCGGSVEGDTLVIQGDQRKRLPALLSARGVKKVTMAV